MTKQSSGKRAKKSPVAVRVPLPQRATYPFETMGVEEAFVAPKSQENSIRSNASRWGKKLDRTFSVRRLTPKEAEFFGKTGANWIGVWRTA